MPIYHPNKIYNFECVLVHKNIDCENKLKPVVFTLYFEVGDKTNIGRYTNSTELKVGSKKYPRFSICDVQGKEIDNKLKTALVDKGYNCPSVSHIVPMIVGASENTICKAEEIQRKGFYALPVRPQ